MKKITTKILIAFFILLLSHTSAGAYLMTQEELGCEIKEKLKIHNEKYLGKDADVGIKLMNLPYGDLNTQNKPEIRVKSNFDKFMYREIVKIEIYDNGKFVKSFPLSVNNLVYKNALCATKPILRGDILNFSNTQIKRVEVGQNLTNVLEKFEGKSIIATKNYSKGALILNNYTKISPDVQKDSPVEIVFSPDNNLKIRIEGRALKEGSIGDFIQVKSIKYNKIYTAVVSAKNEVTVKI